MPLQSNVPPGELGEKWTKYRSSMPLVAPNNKRRLEVIIVGTGLAGGAAAATLGELGYKVKVFTFHDSPRRAHSIAAQGGINAAKNYQNDGDSIYRLFYDTIKGGDYRSREANVHRLAEVSVNIIDQAVAQGVPFAREYGGLLANRSFGGVQVSRTFYARGQTGQQLLLGAYQSLSRQVSLGNVTMYNRHEMVDVVKVDGKARGIIARNLLTGELERLQKRGALLMRRQQYGLQASAYEQVTETRNRLKRFSASAHEGLADLYHRALRSSREREQAPDEAAPQSSVFPLQPPMGSSR